MSLNGSWAGFLGVVVSVNYELKIVVSIVNSDYKYTKTHLTVCFKLVSFMTINYI